MIGQLEGVCGAMPPVRKILLTFLSPAPKYHTKGCSRSSVDSPGARTLVFAAFEPFSSCGFWASIARNTPFVRYFGALTQFSLFRECLFQF